MHLMGHYCRVDYQQEPGDGGKIWAFQCKHHFPVHRDRPGAHSGRGGDHDLAKTRLKSPVFCLSRCDQEVATSSPMLNEDRSGLPELQDQKGRWYTQIYMAIRH